MFLLPKLALIQHRKAKKDQVLVRERKTCPSLCDEFGSLSQAIFRSLAYPILKMNKVTQKWQIKPFRYFLDLHSKLIESTKGLQDSQGKSLDEGDVLLSYTYCVSLWRKEIYRRFACWVQRARLGEYNFSYTVQCNSKT